MEKWYYREIETSTNQFWNSYWALNHYILTLSVITGMIHISSAYPSKFSFNNPEFYKAEIFFSMIIL